jgi:hypothetical protein
MILLIDWLCKDTYKTRLLGGSNGFESRTGAE